MAVGFDFGTWLGAFAGAALHWRRGGLTVEGDFGAAEAGTAHLFQIWYPCN